MLDLFLDRVGFPVAIPSEVQTECCGIKKSLDAFMIQKAVEQSKIRVLAVKDKKMVARLQEDFGLAKGESEAIALALAQDARVLGIDDKNGINACKLMGVAFTTAISILVRMHEKGFLPTGEAMVKLAALARYGRYRQSILDDARQRLEAPA